MTDRNYETSTMTFAALLQEWRAELSLTRAAAAEWLGVPLRTFNGWISGRGCAQETPLRKLMQRIAIEHR